MPFIAPLAFLLVGIFLFWRLDQYLVSPRALGLPYQVGVIIPARNEVTRIAPLLESLALQTLVPDVVLVVDDASTDDTAAIARRLGAQVLPAGPKPVGWNGKTWACWQGAQHVQTDILVFLDADTRLEPTGLEALVYTYLQEGGLLSVQPYHVTYRLYEQFSAFFNLVVVASLNAFTPLNRKLAPGGAFGPCMVCRRDDYFRVGGHQAVREETIEDIPLGQNFERAGLPVRVCLGKGAVTFRMYPNGLGELIEGYSKGLAYGALAVRPWAAILLSAWITGCFSTSVGLMRELTSGPLSWADFGRGVLYLAYALHIHWALGHIGRFQRWVSLLFPIPLFFFGLVMLRSLILTHIFGRVHWKGQRIATRPWGKRFR